MWVASTRSSPSLSRGLGGIKREAPIDDDKRRLVVLPHLMTPADEALNGVRYVGAMANGKHVYENLPKKPQGALSFK